MPTTTTPLIVAITGASGAQLAQRFIHATLAHTSWPIHLIASNAGADVWTHELLGAPMPASQRITQHAPLNLHAPIASGSFPTSGLVVIPCSMASMAKIAHGIADSLLLRAADVTIKERRPLLIVPRESPLSPIHIANMLTLANAGVSIVPPMITLYHQALTLEAMIDEFALRLLAMLGANVPMRQWGD